MCSGFMANIHGSPKIPFLIIIYIQTCSELSGWSHEGSHSGVTYDPLYSKVVNLPAGMGPEELPVLSADL